MPVFTILRHKNLDCSIVSQLTTVPRAPQKNKANDIDISLFCGVENRLTLSYSP
jgi:hypothetical protein